VGVSAVPAKRSSHWAWLAIGAACVALAALVVLFHTCAFQSFSVASSSMEPSLLIGDYLLVDKSAYGYSHYSLPFSPHLFSGRIFAAQPRRGDLVVFRAPRNDRVDYIKRVVGLPGDRIQMKGGALYINGTAVQRERMADFEYASDRRLILAKRWREKLPNGPSYETLEQGNMNTQEFLVPPGSYFVLGDNRDNSLDSRFPSEFGYVPAENLVGRVALIYWSISEDGLPRNARIGLRPR
jgi:signal peptidase I